MPHIFLYGPPGSGKSTVGKTLALNLRLPFIDLDPVIEKNAGMSVLQIMEGQGEQAFRDMESSALKMNVDGNDSVLALGGGALLREENREIVESRGEIILLTAELDTLLARLKPNSKKRPLLAGDVHGKLSQLLAQRAAHYGSFRMQLHVDGKSVEQNAAQAQVLLGRFHLKAMGEYDAIVENDAVARLGQMLIARDLSNPMLVTDENVARLHAEKIIDSLRRFGFDPTMITIPAGEEYKRLDWVSELWQGFLDAGMDRTSTVIALGGGVIGDLAGFAASTFMRGINWASVPTTLLSMVDASLGGKTGFDLPEGKNLIGSFHAPKLVLADPSILRTLPEAELRCGMAEVVKHGIISDPELFSFCGRGLDWVKDNLEEIVKRAMAVKVDIIEQDPYERGTRAKLNLGHTVGHAVELVSKFQLRHGEAVAIGMVAEARYAERIGVADAGLSEALAQPLSALGLPVHIPGELSRAELIRAMRADKKKTAGAIRFALPMEIGNVELVDVTDLESVLDS